MILTEICIASHQALVGRMEGTEFCEKEKMFPSNKLNKSFQPAYCLGYSMADKKD